MIQVENILKSRKRIGIHEKVIIEKLQKYFLGLGYSVIPHARFDVAWGSIISDIDLLLINKDKLILVEVKSSKDNLARAKKQIEVIEDFVDQVYVATDYFPRKWPSKKSGRIVVTQEGIKILKNAEKIKKFPKLDTLLSLRRESLIRLSRNATLINKNMKKYEIATKILKENPDNLKTKLQEIVTCQ